MRAEFTKFCCSNDFNNVPKVYGGNIKKLVIIFASMIISSSAYPQEKTPKVESQVHELLQKHLQNHPMPEVDIR